ncbi:leucyl/phenylalanyl-tRNA--protein transferase [Roseomonas sp. SSH11]|uniref:Leucyl/phenylalanyl-tRNA--protein transferase n=1 Tax=Pararoseomonas baculiformis TaxID=2820812 RepID=A0ABS4AIB0_9PROT|nr:leucyl/phenylalanyl-tRNA--protein transferase [Pararoseomonas baculiformis]MBP0446766.1 leucyl/phenylalanyl-tRNA--protein transferase [Pararoseomonas baculiformis]
MSCRALPVTPDLVLRAYRAGLFPMAEGRGSGRLYWLDPKLRGILPLDRFHLPRSLRRTVLSGRFDVSADTDFPGVLAGCAAPAPGREDSWINEEIEDLFNALHRIGHAHSIEVREGGALVGGLYGIRIGAAFFGESMFARADDASKVALVHLVARLRRGGFTLLDTQFLNDHLARFGGEEIPQADYRARLAQAVDSPATWLTSLSSEELSEEVEALRSITRG